MGVEMKSKVMLGVVFLLLVGHSAFADFHLVGSIPTPDETTSLSGLAAADGLLFAVADYGPDGSCLYVIDPDNGDVIREAWVSASPPGCPGEMPSYVSCAFEQAGPVLEDPLCLDTYWVGDGCGDIIKYNWTAGSGLIYAGHCRPCGLGEPTGLTFYDGYPYVLDRTNRIVFKLTGCYQVPSQVCELPGAVSDPAALTMREGDYFVADRMSGLVHEINGECGPVEIHSLEGFGSRSLAGMTFLDDRLFVASDDDEILIYEFGGAGWEVPEGDSVIVEPLPEELEITFPTVVGAGSLFVKVNPTDSCPAPEGVMFLPSFYEILTTASFDYVAEVAIFTEDPMAEGIDPDLVRIFRRPSGDCTPYMDVTVAPFQIVETLRDPRLSRLIQRLSEDDEFSVFILGEDRRRPLDVIDLKYNYLQEAIDALAGVPVDPYNLMNALLAEALQASTRHNYVRAATLVDRVADVAMATPEIPHTFDPNEPGTNLAGRIMVRAHTLSFSLRLLIEKRVMPLSQGASKLDVNRVIPTLTLSTNPSSSTFEIGLMPGNDEPVTLKIYSVEGRVVRTLADGMAGRGGRTLTWDGLNDDGLRVASGTYFAVLVQGERTATAKLILR
jgi:hypothetical protein